MRGHGAPEDVLSAVDLPGIWVRTLMIIGGYPWMQWCVAVRERMTEVDSELIRFDPKWFHRDDWKRAQRRACRRVYARQLIELGLIDLGGEAGGA